MANGLEQVAFSIKPDEAASARSKQVGIIVTEATNEELEQAADELGVSSLSIAYRYFITMGMRAVAETNPQNQSTNVDTQEYNPLRLRDVLPESEEDALNLRDGELLEALDNEIAREIEDDPMIEKSGWNVWLNK